MKILGIETSCDETGAAILEDDTILSNVVSSQVEVHSEYGGVVPELASREHIKNIDYVIEEALEKSECGLDELELIAVTQGPGLIGSLLVGLNYAKTLAYALDLPLLPVNHVKAHLESVFLSGSKIKLPAVNMVISGGHTHIFYQEERLNYRLVGCTRDDAAGEAFDKVAKLLGLGYPGGPVIEKISKEGDETAIDFPISTMSDGSFDLSFSGLKTAVLRYVRNEDIEPCEGKKDQKPYTDIAASFQKTIVEDLLQKCKRVCRSYRPYSICITGGVSINSRLRERFRDFARQKKMEVHFPEPDLTTDNAAMIAYYGFLAKEEAKPPDLRLNAISTLDLNQEQKR